MTQEEGQRQARAKTLTATYAELQKFVQTGDYDRAFKACNRILHMSPDEEKAFACKVACLMQQSKFGEALQSLNKAASLSGELRFERAYCLYRLNRTDEALDVLESAVGLDPRLKELKAQVLYRLERYAESLELYDDIVKNSSDDYGDERATNVTAIIAQLSDEDLQRKMGALRSDTYELCYNLACLEINKGRYAEAERLLGQCEKLCRESLEEEGASEEEVEVELALMRIQLGYVYQQQGRTKDAQAAYSASLKLKLDDVALVAVASNNLVVINKDQNVFDSRKKMKAATSELLAHKLLGEQRKRIALNNAILALYTNQNEACAKLSRGLVEQFPSLGLEASLLLALCSARASNGDAGDATRVLRDYQPKDEGERLHVELARAHLLLSQGDQLGACEVLENLGDATYKPGVVGALITLYTGTKRKEQAVRIFERTVEWYRRNEADECDLTAMWRQAADFQMRNNQAAVAANCLEELVRTSPSDRRAIAQLAIAYLQFDKRKAAGLLAKLPPLPQTCTDSDIDAFETSWVSLRKTAANQSDASPRTPKTSETPKQKNKKKRNKKKHPGASTGGGGAPPDPERWLPKYERTGYRKKRDRRTKEVMKGSQGVASGQADQFDFSKVSETEQASAGSSVEPSPQPRHQQPKRGPQKSKKTKRR